MRTRIVGIAAIGTLAVCGTALAPPAAGSSTLAEREHRAESTAIQPGSLDKGKRPQALYMQGRRIYDGKRTFKVRGPKGLSLVGKGDGGYLAVRYGMYDGHLWQIRPHRKPRHLAVVTEAGYNGGDEYWVNDAGNRLAITEPERTDTDFMWVRQLPSGKKIRFRWVDDGTDAIAFPKSRVLFTNYRETYWYAPRQDKRTEVTGDTAVIADPDENRMVVWGEQGEDRFQLVEFDDPSNVLAGWQHGRGLEISPDGEYFLAKDDKQKLQIRKLDDGSLVRTFAAAGRIDTASARWESGRRVLFTAKGHKVAANVRCTVGGDCVRTTRLVKRPGQLGIDWPQ